MTKVQIIEAMIAMVQAELDATEAVGRECDRAIEKIRIGWESMGIDMQSILNYAKDSGELSGPENDYECKEMLDQVCMGW